jgi:hypothetical protein
MIRLTTKHGTPTKGAGQRTDAPRVEANTVAGDLGLLVLCPDSSW